MSNYIRTKQFRIWCIYVDMFGNYGKRYNIKSIRDYYLIACVDERAGYEVKKFINRHGIFKR